MKTSITPTYDSRETGPRYWVTTRVGDRVIAFHQPLDDPFARTWVNLSVRDLLLGVLRRGLKVEVTIGADSDVMDDVLELDSNQLVLGRTRRAEFNGQLHRALSTVAVDEELREITEPS
jgi:hypothetical protein